MKTRSIKSASLWVMAFAVVSCGQPPESEPSEYTRHSAQELDARPRQRLILSAAPAPAESVETHYVTPEQWSTLTAEQFEQYEVLVIDQEDCEDASRALEAASANREVWGRLIDGNVFLTTASNDKQYFEQGVTFASQEPGKTGLYLSLGCAYESAAPGTPVMLLEPFGTFTVEGAGCRAGALCEASAVFTQYPARAFSPGALASDSRGRDTPYTLTHRASESSTPIAGSPPVARCKTVVMTATDTCGFEASIDAGSSDPDGDLVECTQSPAGPYGLGTTSITLTCRDLASQESSCTGAVTVADANAPTLSLVGPPQVAAECGRPAVDPGVTAFDLCEGDLSARVSMPRIHTGTPGSLTVMYGVQDSAGNSAAPVARTFNVQDTLAPELTVLGPTQGTSECGYGYSDPGATAQDVCFGDLTSAIVPALRGSLSVGSVFQMDYRVTDPAGNTRILTGGRQVTVRDTQPPMLFLKGPAPMVFQCGSGTFSDLGAGAIDVCEGDISQRVVRTGTVKETVPGTYPLEYSVTDSSGNRVGGYVRSVQVVDTLGPVLSVSGPSNTSYECGSGPFPYPRATAMDMCDLSVEPRRQGAVYEGIPFTYQYSFWAVDRTGNPSSANMTVTVRDTLPPEVRLQGPAQQMLECGTPYVDPGVTAVDLCSWATLVKSGSVNWRQPGRYTLSYSATDLAGNRAVPALRTVNVVDTQAPSIALLGASSQEVSAGMPYSDPGATAADQCSGLVTVSVTGSVNTSVPGTYVLRFSARDRAGNTSQTLTRTVTVSGDAESLTTRSSEQ
jgi:hypothetical protein